MEDRIVPATNYSVAAVPFTATLLSTSDPSVFTIIPYGDQVANPVPLGTNHLNFYGGDYTDQPGHYYLWASAKGILTIYNPDTGFGNSDLTTAPNVPTIAALWSDWNKPPGATPMVVGKFDVPDNLLIVQWNDITHFAGNGNTVTFQVVLQLNTGTTPGNITVNYFNIDTGDKNANGDTSTIGLKDWGPQGPNRILVSYNTPNPLIGSYQSIQFTWGQPVPAPVISSLSPNTAPETSPALPLTVNGSNFASNAVIQLNGTALPTTFLNSSQLQATLPSSALTEDGILEVTVYNPGSPGKTSDPFAFPVYDALLTAQSQTLAATEGQPLTNVVVATFTDPGSDGTTADYTATITWTDINGQVHNDPGTIQAVDAHTFNVLAANLGPYAQVGAQPVGVAIADKGGSNAAAQAVVNVSDAPLTAQGQTLAATEGQALNNAIVASFTDPAGNGTTANYTATITWTDSGGQTHTLPATIQATGAQTFNVVAGNLGPFAEEGAYPVNVTITDQGSSTSAQTTVNVGDAPLTAQGQTLATLEGQSLTNVLVGTFTDAGSDGTIADYTATITWTDSGGQTHTASGTIQATGPQTFNVLAGNLGPFAEEGTYSVSVAIFDKGGSSTSTQTTVNVADAPLTAQGQTLAALEGQSLTNVLVGTFTDSGSDGTIADYTATLTWTDSGGQTHTAGGTIQAVDGHTFNVLAPNLGPYAEEGSYTVNIAVADKGGSSTSTQTTVNVNDAPLTVQGQTLTTLEGQSLTNVLVATFTDPGSDGTTADYTATITWTDSGGQTHTLAGTIQATGAQTFNVVAGNLGLFAEEGAYTVNVTIFDKGGSSTSIQTTVNVADAPLTAQGQTLATLEGQGLSNVVVATFTDSGSDGTTADYTATITWTDSGGQTHTASGTIQATGPQTFNVLAGNLGPFAEEGTYLVSVTIADKGGSNAAVQAVVNVSDAPLMAQGQILSTTEGQALTNVLVATFTDPGSDGTTGDYAATITWTDHSGQSHAITGTIQAVNAHTFNVLAGNLGTFTEEGTYAIRVTITDQGGRSAALVSTVNVADAALTSTGQNVNATTGLGFTSQVATFTDANPNAQASDFTATITWGDGQTSPGTITANGNGGFNVTGTHTFASAGTYALSVRIVDQGGAATTALAKAVVTDSIPDLTVTLTQNRFNLRQVQLNGTFSDLVAKHHTAVINWGDGTISRIDLGISAGGTFSLTHLYTARFASLHKSTNIQVTIVDDDGTSSPVDVLYVSFHHHQ